jgi:uncharacterized metal-binding protein
MTGLGYPEGVAVDSAGDIFAGDYADGDVVEVLANCISNCVVTLLTVNHPHYVAVDSSGTVYVTATPGPGGNQVGSGEVIELTGCPTNCTVKTLLTGLAFPQGVAVDSTGHVYIADLLGGDIIQLSGCPSNCSETADLQGYGYPWGIATDSAGNVYVTAHTDPSGSATNVVDELTGCPSNCALAYTLASGYYFMSAGVAVDGNGNVYVSSYEGNYLDELSGCPTNCLSQVILNTQPLLFGVATDPHGDVYVAPTNPGVIIELPAYQDDDLAISTPSNITSPATSPRGASVTYALTVTDEGGETPSTNCDHTPGSVFPIGTTTVNCSASDPDDTNSPASTSFTVTVKGAADQMSDLAGAVRGVGPGTSLSDKVVAAQTELANGYIGDTCSTLRAFVNEVNAQTAKSVPAILAGQLVAVTQRILAVLSC